MTLTEWQTQVLDCVRESAPHAKRERLVAILDSTPAHVQLAIDALIRRGLVTPIEVWPDGEVYIATAKGRRQ